MSDQATQVDLGIAGSLTMAILVLAFTVLVISFYRRYKRAAAAQPQHEQSVNGDQQ
jgi:heme/copper-type cytochrome/quinol oxidase subunit 2